MDRPIENYCKKGGLIWFYLKVRSKILARLQIVGMGRTSHEIELELLKQNLVG